MCFAVTIKCARLRIISKTHRAVLVCDSGERNALAEEQIPGNKAFVALVPVNRAFGLYCNTISPSRLMVTRLFGSGRSSDVSQKSNECLPIKSSVHFGATFGAPAFSVSPSSLPTNEMCPIGNAQSGER